MFAIIVSCVRGRNGWCRRRYCSACTRIVLEDVAAVMTTATCVGSNGDSDADGCEFAS